MRRGSRWRPWTLRTTSASAASPSRLLQRPSRARSPGAHGGTRRGAPLRPPELEGFTMARMAVVVGLARPPSHAHDAVPPLRAPLPPPPPPPCRQRVARAVFGAACRGGPPPPWPTVGAGRSPPSTPSSRRRNGITASPSTCPSWRRSRAAQSARRGCARASRRRDGPRRCRRAPADRPVPGRRRGGRPRARARPEARRGSRPSSSALRRTAHASGFEGTSGGENREGPGAGRGSVARRGDRARPSQRRFWPLRSRNSGLCGIFPR